MDGSKKTASLTINIVNLVDTVTISGSSTIQAGKNITYTRVVSPVRASDKSVNWSVSAALPPTLTEEQMTAYNNLKNPITIATNGKLTVNRAVPVGTTITIKAESKDGSLVKAIKMVTVSAL